MKRPRPVVRAWLTLLAAAALLSATCFVLTHTGTVVATGVSAVDTECSSGARGTSCTYPHVQPWIELDTALGERRVDIDARDVGRYPRGSTYTWLR